RRTTILVPSGETSAWLASERNGVRPAPPEPTIESPPADESSKMMWEPSAVHTGRSSSPQPPPTAMRSPRAPTPTSSLPDAVVLNAIFEPSGLHDGAPASPDSWENCVWFDPSAFIVNTWGLPFRSLVKAIFRPSGDQLGSSSSLPGLVSGVTVTW